MSGEGSERPGWSGPAFPARLELRAAARRRAHEMGHRPTLEAEAPRRCTRRPGPEPTPGPDAETPGANPRCAGRRRGAERPEGGSRGRSEPGRRGPGTRSGRAPVGRGPSPTSRWPPTGDRRDPAVGHRAAAQRSSPAHLPAGSDPAVGRSRAPRLRRLARPRRDDDHARPGLLGHRRVPDARARCWASPTPPATPATRCCCGSRRSCSSRSGRPRSAPTCCPRCSCRAPRRSRPSPSSSSPAAGGWASSAASRSRSRPSRGATPCAPTRTPSRCSWSACCWCCSSRGRSGSAPAARAPAAG